MNYLEGYWYVAAFIHEITTLPIRRVLFDRPIVLFRTQDGQAVALNDVCPHRRAPLHLGRVMGNEIACPYHGLRFDSSGKCSHNPNFRDPIPNVRARCYAVVERHHMVWIWMGDADSATPATIPDFSRTAAADVKPVHGYLKINAREPLISDNLLDLSHTEFLHPYLANEGFNSRLQQDVRQEGDAVYSLYSIANEPMTPLLAHLWDKDPITHADMRFHMRWEPPSCLLLEVGATAPGHANADGVAAYVSHLLTPETATSTHYFWTFARDSHKGNQQFDTHLQASISQAFVNEDAPIIEWQERYEQLPESKAPARPFLRGDAGAARARRVVEKLATKG
jgi:vanillate O-demethylase monooxygenase subunit